MALPAVTLCSLVVLSPSASAKGVIVLGKDTTDTNPVYNLAEVNNSGIIANEDGSGYTITTSGFNCAIENSNNSKISIPVNNTILVGEGKTLTINHNAPDNTTLRMSAGAKNPFALEIVGNLNIVALGGEIATGDAIVCVNEEAHAPQAMLKVTGNMETSVFDTQIVASRYGSYGIGIAEGDLNVGGDFRLKMRNISYRSKGENPAMLTGLFLGTGATDGKTPTLYTFEQSLLVEQVELLFNSDAEVPSMSATGVCLDDYGYSEAWEDMRVTRTLTVAEDFSVTNVSVKANTAVAEAYGLQILGSESSATVSGATTISGISAETKSGEYAYAVGIEASDGAQVRLEGDVTIDKVTATGSPENEAYALVAFSGARIDINPEDSAEKIIAIEGDMQISDENTKVNVKLGNAESYFTGFFTKGEGAPEGKTYIHLKGGAVWNVVPANTPTATDKGYYECNVTSLTANGANICIGTTIHAATEVKTRNDADCFAEKYESLKYTDKPTQLRTEILKGSGSTFYVRAKIDVADSLVIEKESEGSHKLMVASSGEGGKEVMDSFLVQRQAGSADFSLANTGEIVDIGVYNYVLDTRESTEVEGAKEWYLKRVAEPAPEPTPTPEPTPQPVFSPTGEAVLALSSPSAQTALFLQNLSTLRGRLGEIRTGRLAGENIGTVVAPGKNVPAAQRVHRPQGFYARTAAGLDHVPGFRGQDFRNNYWGGAVGYFRQAGEQWLLGAEFNTMQGKQRLQHPNYLSKGESESYGMLLAATWYNKYGVYCDMVLGFDRYEQELSAHMLDGTPVSATFNSFSPAASIEFGRKCLMGRQKKWFIEPQAQLTYYRAGGDDYVTSNGMNVSRPATDSLTGRLGFALGRSHLYPGGKGLQWHIDAGVQHEFGDDAKATVNGETFTASSLGTRIYYGVGGEYNISPRTQVYGYVGQEKGSDYKSDCNARLGIKVTF